MMNHLPQSRFNQSSALVALPAELQTEILMSLTWKDVLNVQMTCEWLYQVTRSRAVWAHLVEEYIANHPCPPRLERPISMYSSAELERLWLLWKRTDAIFAGQYTAPICRRTFSTAKVACYTHLVDGGRWLFSIDLAGAVTYCDLDAEAITETPLIPARICYRENNQVWTSIDYDKHSPTVKFTLALFLTDQIIGMKYSGWFYIWSISLLLDSSQRSVGFVATSLATFPLRRTVLPPTSLSLFGDHLAFNARNTEIHAAHVYVVCWKDANGQSDIYPWRMLQRCFSTADIYLLSGSRLLIICFKNVTLYNYATIEAMPHPMTATLPICLWDHKFSRCVRPQSEPFYTRTATRFVLVGQDTFYILEIKNDPLPNVVPPISSFRHDHRIRFCSALGPSRAITFDDEMNAELVQYFVKVSHKTTLFSLDAYSTCCDLEEHTGRIVISAIQEGQESVVIDLALSSPHQ